MSHDASELLGESQVAGASVKPIGSASRQAAIIGPGVGGGLAAGATSRLMDGKKSRDLRSSQTPRFGSLGFLAVTDQELALIRVNMGVTKGKLVGRRGRGAAQPGRVRRDDRCVVRPSRRQLRRRHSLGI